MSLETSSPSKVLVEGVFVATCTINEAPTNRGNCYWNNRLEDSFLNFLGTSASEAHDDIVTTEALAGISSPTFEDMVDKSSGQPKVALEGKWTAVFKESSQSDAKKQGNGEAEADLYAMDPSSSKQGNPIFWETRIIFI